MINGLNKASTSVTMTCDCVPVQLSNSFVYAISLQWIMVFTHFPTVSNINSVSFSNIYVANITNVNLVVLSILCTFYLFSWPLWGKASWPRISKTPLQINNYHWMSSWVILSQVEGLILNDILFINLSNGLCGRPVCSLCCRFIIMIVYMTCIIKQIPQNVNFLLMISYITRFVKY